MECIEISDFNKQYNTHTSQLRKKKKICVILKVLTDQRNFERSVEKQINNNNFFLSIKLCSLINIFIFSASDCIPNEEFIEIGHFNIKSFNIHIYSVQEEKKK